MLCYISFEIFNCRNEAGCPIAMALLWHCYGMAHEMAWDDIMKIYRFSFTLKNAIIIKAVKKTGEISLKTQKNQ